MPLICHFRSAEGWSLPLAELIAEVVDTRKDFQLVSWSEAWTEAYSTLVRDFISSPCASNIRYLISSQEKEQRFAKAGWTLDDGEAKRHMDARLNARAARILCESQTNYMWEQFVFISFTIEPDILSNSSRFRANLKSMHSAKIPGDGWSRRIDRTENQKQNERKKRERKSKQDSQKGDH